jgi:hypothetical protein
MLQIATFGRQTTAATFSQCITTTSLPAGATTSCLIFNGDGVLEGHPRLTIGSVRFFGISVATITQPSLPSLALIGSAQLLQHAQPYFNLS